MILIFAVNLELAAHAGQLLAGAARISITPSADEFPCDGPGNRKFVGVHDDVYVRVLVLDDGKQRIGLVILDQTKVPSSLDLVKAVAQELAVPESHVLVSATHTHNVPLVSYNGGTPNKVQQTELEHLQQAAVAAARQAKAQLQPARIAFARGEAWVNENGGSYLSPTNSGKMEAQEDIYFPQRPSDKSVDVVRVESLKGEPLALLLNYATHGEVMFRSVTKDNGYEISGDLPGAVAHLLEGSSAAAPIVLFTSGAEADQLPLFKSLQPTGKLGAADEGAGGWALLDAQARRLANSVLDSLADMQPGVADVQLSASAGTVTCPGKYVSNPHESAPADTAVPLVKIPISIFRINDIALAGVGGDVASEIGQRFKKASPLAHTTFISMMAGDIGYILTDAIYEDKSLGENHGVGKSPLKSGCAEPAIIQGLLGLIGTDSKDSNK